MSADDFMGKVTDLIVESPFVDVSVTARTAAARTAEKIDSMYAARIEELEAENARLRDGLVDLRFGSDAELSAAIGRLLDHKVTP